MELLTINGLGSKQTYGFVLEEDNYKQFFQGLKTKPKYAYGWNDKDGDEVDPNEVTRFESVVYSFSIIFSCASFVDFNNKYDAFVNVIKAPNGSVWSFTELNKTYRLHLQDVSNAVDIDIPSGKAKVTIQLKNNWQL